VIIVVGPKQAFAPNEFLAIIHEMNQLALRAPMVNKLKLCIAEAIRLQLAKRSEGTFGSTSA
jgi:hypothetical protein